MNLLVDTHPYLSEEFHSTLNGKVTFNELTRGSDRKIWWQCNKADDHTWLATVSARVRGTGCPYCNGKKLIYSLTLEGANKILAEQWHPTLNENLTPDKIAASSKSKIWWICPKNSKHQWQAQVYSRHKGIGCPFCSNRAINDENNLARCFPEIASQWHYERNRPVLPEQIAPHSGKKFWWKCKVAEDHIWEASADTRHKAGCPICANRITVNSNALTNTHAELLKEWDFERNSHLNPQSINAGSNLKVYWQCKLHKDHFWLAAINKRTAKKNPTGCPFCSNLKIASSNCLATTHPQLSKEWCYELNGDLIPEKVVWGSHQKVFWRCEYNSEHIWKATIVHRASRNQGCPECRITNTSKNELEILFELMLIFNNISPLNNTIWIDHKIHRVDINIPRLKLVIEYDGSFWHLNKVEKDRQKTHDLIKAGYRVIRLRQLPLQKITIEDIITEKEFNCKKTTDRILLQILQKYDIDKRTQELITNYLSKNTTQNSFKYDEFINELKSGEIDKFINRSNHIFNNRYDYSLVNYKNASEKVEIICTEHGSFLKSPSNHLNGQGCPKCGRINGGKSKLMGLDVFLEKARLVHGERYDYSNTTYEKTHSNITICCSIHGTFLQSPSNHLRGQGCPHCGREQSILNRPKKYKRREEN